MSPVRHVVGCMSGTSLDGIDTTLIAIEGRGASMKPRFLRGASAPLGAAAPVLRALASGEALTAEQLARAMRDFALAHVAALRSLLSGQAADLVVVHGQTVFHRPPLSWQLFQPAELAAALNAPVVFDLRAADLAAGGQGAPITPLADFFFFSHSDECRAVLNLGGFSNFTLLPPAGPGAITGGDICACNQLLDSLCRALFARDFDEDGRLASGGATVPDAFSQLVALLDSQSGAGRSLGTGDELPGWAAQARGSAEPADLLRTACEAVAEVIARRLRPTGARRLLLAGGGSRNRTLRAAIEARCGFPAAPTDDFGLPAQYREAAQMALLGALCEDGVPITLPRVTGVSTPAPISGAFIRPPRPSTPARDLPPPQTGAAPIPADRSHILTEQRNPRTERLGSASVRECVELLAAEDRTIHDALDRARPALVAFVEAAEPGFLAGGRLVYTGAGTSGRLGVLDASEAPPTFHVEPGRIVGIIAGGESALRRSSEGAEDDPEGARSELTDLDLGANDVLLGIAAGGTTPYVLGALAIAKSLPTPPLTALLTCTPIDPPTACDHLIVVETGPEALTGSTRLKAGTVTKLILNSISTTLMVRSGRIYRNLMVDLRATNSKLRDRAARIVTILTGLGRADSLALLDRAGGSVKAAVVMQRRGLDLPAAQELLDDSHGFLAAALGE